LHSVPRSPFLHVAPPTAALALGALRWSMQGSGNRYTATSKRFYVPDLDLGWRIADTSRLWLGLEVLAILAAVALGFVAVALFVRWRERKTGAPMRRLRVLGWILAALPLAIPLYAFATGGRPDGAVDALPKGVAAAPDHGVDGKLAAPAGTYTIAPVDGSAISAHLEAGGESFDARFAGDLHGTLAIDPRDLAQPMRAQVSAVAASVDTGIALRSAHARDEYLHVDKFPAIGFDLVRLIAAKQDGPAQLAFKADGVVHLMGKDHPVTVDGTLRAVDDAAAARLGVKPPALIATADFVLHIKDTALAADAGDFDRDEVPVHVSLIWIPDKH
jgi:polyisoprenoid-binding protein YceI